MARYRKTWKDDLGRRWPVPKAGLKIRPTERKAHAALRRFVFIRDAFTCRDCGAKPRVIPASYDGVKSIAVFNSEFQEFGVPLHIDHVKPRIHGGNNDPLNLAALCESCNSRKAGSHHG